MLYLFYTQCSTHDFSYRKSVINLCKYNNNISQFSLKHAKMYGDIYLNKIIY